HTEALKSCGPAVMTAAANSGGGSCSSAHWVKPRYDTPTVANRPVNQGCSRSQTTVSAAASASLTIGSKAPPDPNVPPPLCNTTWYPRAAYSLAYTSENGNPRPYGPRTSKVPTGLGVVGA